jgi:hypothetical protein
MGGASATREGGGGLAPGSGRVNRACLDPWGISQSHEVLAWRQSAWDRANCYCLLHPSSWRPDSRVFGSLRLVHPFWDLLKLARFVFGYWHCWLAFYEQIPQAEVTTTTYWKDFEQGYVFVPTSILKTEEAEVKQWQISDHPFTVFALQVQTGILLLLTPAVSLQVSTSAF